MQPIPAIALAVILANEVHNANQRHTNRERVYGAAQKRALAVGRPLVVVGDPDSGLHTSLRRAYGCGDACVDLNGCPTCVISHMADIQQRLPFGDDSQVVFVSCVFEYVKNFDAAWNEIIRIAGSPKNIFVVSVQPRTFTAALYPGAQRTVTALRTSAEDETIYRENKISNARKAASAAALAGLLALSLWRK
ncbi:MAG: hypothetical protein ACYTEQ_12245 [Planctomycetota bacterium]|jgi:hypothetical protein